MSGLFNFFVNMIAAPGRYLHLGFPLVGVYVAWIVVLALLYPLCRWWAKVKRTRRGLVAVVLMTRLPGRRVTGPESKHHIDSAPRMAPNLVREIAPARS